MGSAVAGNHAVIDHLVVWRKYVDLYGIDRIGGYTGFDDFLERLGRRHGLPRGTPWLERNLAQRVALAQSVGERGAIRRDAVHIREETAINQLNVGGKTLLGRARGAQSIAARVAQREPARATCRIVVAYAGRRERQRERQRVGRDTGIELAQPRGDRSDGEWCRKIGRPAAAAEHRRPVD